MSSMGTERPFEGRFLIDKEGNDPQWPCLVFEDADTLQTYLPQHRMAGLSKDVVNLLGIQRYLATPETFQADSVAVLLGPEHRGREKIVFDPHSADCGETIQECFASCQQTPGWMDALKELGERMTEYCPTNRAPISLDGDDGEDSPLVLGPLGELDEEESSLAQTSNTDSDKDSSVGHQDDTTVEHSTTSSYDRVSGGSGSLSSTNSDYLQSSEADLAATPKQSNAMTPTATKRKKRVTLDPQTVVKPNKRTKAKGKRQKAVKSPPPSAPKRKRQPAIKSPRPSARKAKSTTKSKPLKYVDDDKIPTLKDVMQLLRKIKCKQNGRYWCLPGVNPSDPSAVEGQDYFANGELLRKHLCAFGIDGTALNVTEKATLQKWIRCAIIPSLRNETALPSEALQDPPGVKACWSLLQKIGFSYRSGKYCTPNAKESFHMDGSYGLWANLARHGLPSDCDFSKITNLERLKLELFIADCPDVDTFIVEDERTARMKRRKNGGHETPSNPRAKRPKKVYEKRPKPAETEQSTGTLQPSSPSDGTLVTVSPTSTDAKKPSSVKMVDQSSQEANEADSTSMAPTDLLTQEPMMETINPNWDDDGALPATKLSFDETSDSNSASVSDQANNTSVQAPDESTIDKLEENNGSICEKAGTFLSEKTTLEEKLDYAGTVLQPSYNAAVLAVPDKSGATPSKFRFQLAEIQSFLRGVSTSAGAKGRGEESPILHVCGATGVGKTSTVQWCCEQSRIDKGRDNALFCFLNATASHSDWGHRVSTELSITMGRKVSKTTNLGDVRNYLQDAAKKSQTVVLVIDEVDFLVSNKGGGGTGQTNKSERALAEIFVLAQDPALPFGVIGISNSVGNHHVNRLRNLGMPSQTVPFTSYGVDSLTKIVTTRIGLSLVAPRALEFAAKKVAGVRGDARKMLELIASSIQICKESLADTTLRDEAEVTKPLVTLKHVMSAIRNDNPSWTDRIAALPKMAKAILCVAMATAKEYPAIDSFEVARLRTYCVKVLSMEFSVDSLDLSAFTSIVEQLFDAGLLLGGDSFGEHGSVAKSRILRLPVRLGTQLEDVESALDKVLGDTSWYPAIMEQVKSCEPPGKTSFPIA